MPSRPVIANGANQVRSRQLASERKSYHLTFHQDEDQPKGFFCITETRVAFGTQKKLPRKWQVSSSSRTPKHREKQPVNSILRGATASCSELVVTDSANEKRLRFSSRVDQRFYIKNSMSNQQLVKLKWDGSMFLLEDPGASPSSFDLMDIPSSTEPPSDGIQNFIDAVEKGLPINKIITILQKEVDRTHPASSVASDWFLTLYNSIKLQVKMNSPLPSSNLTQIHKLLCIYKHAEAAIGLARAMKQWSRFDVTIESISNLRFSNGETADIDNNELMVAEIYYSSDRTAQRLLGKLPSKALLAGTIDYTKTVTSHKEGVKRYCLNHNFGLADEKPELTLQLRQGEASLGSVILPCSLFKYFSTQPKETFTVERQLAPEGGLQKGAKAKFSIRKVPLKPGFLEVKRDAVATQINQVISWVRKFNDVNSSLGKSLLSTHICGQGNVSLLHASIYAQDVGLVKTLMNMGANPYCHSSIGSAMTLALNQSDRPHQGSADKQRFDDMIRLMQGHYNKCVRTSNEEKENGRPKVACSKRDDYRKAKSPLQSKKKHGIASQDRQRVLGILSSNAV